MERKQTVRTTNRLALDKRTFQTRIKEERIAEHTQEMYRLQSKRCVERIGKERRNTL